MGSLCGSWAVCVGVGQSVWCSLCCVHVGRRTQDVGARPSVQRGCPPTRDPSTWPCITLVSVALSSSSGERWLVSGQQPQVGDPGPEQTGWEQAQCAQGQLRCPLLGISLPEMEGARTRAGADPLGPHLSGPSASCSRKSPLSGWEGSGETLERWVSSIRTQGDPADLRETARDSGLSISKNYLFTGITPSIVPV